MSAPYKLLPVITDYCHGCGLCADACQHGCLNMVWDFARLEAPVDCGSEGICMEVCPQNAIHMEWVAMNGDHKIGQWCDEPPAIQQRKTPFWGFLRSGRV